MSEPRELSVTERAAVEAQERLAAIDTRIAELDEQRKLANTEITELREERIQVARLVNATKPRTRKPTATPAAPPAPPTPPDPEG